MSWKPDDKAVCVEDGFWQCKEAIPPNSMPSMNEVVSVSGVYEEGGKLFLVLSGYWASDGATAGWIADAFRKIHDADTGRVEEREEECEVVAETPYGPVVGQKQPYYKKQSLDEFQDGRRVKEIDGSPISFGEFCARRQFPEIYGLGPRRPKGKMIKRFLAGFFSKKTKEKEGTDG